VSSPAKAAAWPASWTSPTQLKERMKRLWDSGQLGQAVLGGATLFPLRLPIKGPASREWGEHLVSIPAWIQALNSAADKQWQLE